MFGFGRLGSYNYFAHVEKALARRFADAGHELVAHVISDLPTASIRRRAARLAQIVTQTSAGEPIHLLGHSTGGLDARLLASPATTGLERPWLAQLRSVTTMNTPHFGTPLAAFFATANGQRALAALSVLTYTGLTVGARPLAAASAILGFVRGADKALPLKIAVIDRAVSSIVGLVDDVRAPEVRSFLTAIHDDQGSMLQLSPEAMDLVVGGFGDRPGVRYQCTASMAPPPKPRGFLSTLGHPWRTVSLSLFYALHKITAGTTERYPCAAMVGNRPFTDEVTEAKLRPLGATLGDNDGIVPIRSQLWGELAWVGHADHLDVLGHHREDEDPTIRDWLVSGSEFGAREFAALMDAVGKGMLSA